MSQAESGQDCKAGEWRSSSGCKHLLAAIMKHLCLRSGYTQNIKSIKQSITVLLKHQDMYLESILYERKSLSQLVI